MKALLIVFAVIGLGLSVLMTVSGKNKTGYYQVISKEGAFEVREYQSLPLVSTSMDLSQRQRGTPFNRLFRYISGSNENNQKIAMTSPVFSSRTGDNFKMSFVLPDVVANEGAPLPNNPNVKLEQMKPGKYAVVRFNGYAQSYRVEKAEEALTNWIKKQNLCAGREILLAGYDPPYTRPSVRRNEVLVRLEENTKNCENSSIGLKNLEDFQWKNRIILVRDQNKNALNQINNSIAEINDRQINWFHLDGEKIKTNYSGKISQDFVVFLRQNYFDKLNSGTFLIRKDGGIKSMDKKLSLKDYFKQIDQMPMRINEMRAKN